MSRAAAIRLKFCSKWRIYEHEQTSGAMRIVCSWCRREGKFAVIGEKAPMDDHRETHGICGSHRLAVQMRWKGESSLSVASTAGELPHRKPAWWLPGFDFWQGWWKPNRKHDRHS